jgi:hypothetical protein
MPCNALNNNHQQQMSMYMYVAVIRRSLSLPQKHIYLQDPIQSAKSSARGESPNKSPTHSSKALKKNCNEYVSLMLKKRKRKRRRKKERNNGPPQA